MRRGELKGLQWTSIDWENRALTVRHSHSDESRALESTKSDRERHIPLDAEVRELLLARKKAQGFVFAGPDGKPFHGQLLNRRLAEVCGKSGLRIITWHVLRHTFATQLAMKSVPLNSVQALLGHSGITTTMRYAHVAPSSLRTAIDLLNPHGQDHGQPVGNHWQNLPQEVSGPQNVSAERT